jgi:predicted CopG family antitoxin
VKSLEESIKRLEERQKELIKLLEAVIWTKKYFWP